MVMQPVFKAASTGIPGSKKIVAPLGGQDISPQKDILKPNSALIAPWSADMYPRQPARSVYTSPLIADDEAALLIFEMRYRSKCVDSLPTSAAPNDGTGPALNTRINIGYDLDRITKKLMTSCCGSTVVVKNIQNIAQKEVQKSLPKNLNTCIGEVKMMVEIFRQSSLVTSPNKSPVRIPAEYVDSCAGGVRKMVESFSQGFQVTSPNTAPVRMPPGDAITCTREVKRVEATSKSSLVTSPNNSSVRKPLEDVSMCTRRVKKLVEEFSQIHSPNNVPDVLPEDVNMCTARRVKKMVEIFSQNSLVTSPNSSSVRTSPGLKEFNTSQSESANVNLPVEMALSEPDEPATSGRRDAERQKLSPKVETQEVLPINSVPTLLAYETLEESPVNSWSYNVDNFLEDTFGFELFPQSMSSINSVPESVFAEDSGMSLLSSDSASVQTTTTDESTFSCGFHYPRLENTVEYQRPVLQSSLPLRTSGVNDDRVHRLTMEVSIQRSLVAQTSKALYLCRTLKQFKESGEMVEAERILLLASLRHQVAQDELKKCVLPPSISASRGTVTISEIFVPLKWEAYRKLNQNLCSQWFVCVLISGERVEATEVVKVVDRQSLLKFQNSIYLSDLSCNFRARLQLYVLRAPQRSDKGKCKLVRACKILRRPTRNCLRPAESIEALIDFRNTAFTMIGCTELTVELIGQVQPVSCSLQEVPTVSLVKGTINFRLSARLLKAREHSSFLNVLRPVREENAWERWWCHLDGKALHCWNYPADQEEKDPVYSIDLVECQSEKVVPAPRVLCSRPRTLLLESQRWGDYSHELRSSLLVPSLDLSIVRHFLSCDSTAEMAEWSSAMNECIDATHLWNKTSPK